MPDRIFINYSRTDQEYSDAFYKHLRVALGSDERLEIWADTEIEASADWDREIETTLEQIRVAVLLVSTDFLDSECIRERELPLLLRRRLQEKLILTPLFVRPSVVDEWEFPVQIPGQDSPQQIRITQFQGLNTPGNPLSRLPESDREIVLLHAARTVRDLALRPYQPGDRDRQPFQPLIDTDITPLEKADVMISNATSSGRPIVGLGWSNEEALETRMRLRTFEDDWDAPGMEVYDEL
ncbi:toll/interleukin-1 receptor domain-containing protein [Candidatus Thiosymbion oneisti]|uniref:toll/interleukin-1 receptor domain-containing protein n=1 Tax=Candidatus Thiosymbion oneisti TaxID=589554 RepID=UPI00105F9C21|nr:toll/interleukin-1 receptor domain-containing protein [Candidatus Thiosymbion oneisti]